jgi:hypothetical protein
MLTLRWCFIVKLKIMLLIIAFRSTDYMHVNAAMVRRGHSTLTTLTLYFVVSLYLHVKKKMTLAWQVYLVSSKIPHRCLPFALVVRVLVFLSKHKSHVKTCNEQCYLSRTIKYLSIIS